jgi:hypothetical protein
MRRKFLDKASVFLALAGAGLAASLGMAPAATAATPATWQDVFQVAGPGNHAVAFTSVVATGTASGYAFEATGSGPAAYQRTGATTWKQVPFPGIKWETIFATKATSPSNVWAFSEVDVTAHVGGRVFRLVRGRWTVVKTFPFPIKAATVFSSSDVWVFADQFTYPSVDRGGVYHYNGHTWTQVSGTLSGGYAVSDSDVWAFHGMSVANYNGHKWTTTSLAKYLPTGVKSVNNPVLISVVAPSATNVYAIAGYNLQSGGLLAVLHFNGHTWARAAEGDYETPGTPEDIGVDAWGGLWIPALGPSPTYNPVLLHYYGGKLTQMTLPAPPGALAFTAYYVVRVPGTPRLLVAGDVGSPDGSQIYAEILQSS